MMRPWVLAIMISSLFSFDATAQPPAVSVHANELYVSVPASAQYRNPGLLKRLVLGKNYRKQWETPVALPVFDLKAQGFRVKALGGGMQTKSLEMEDAQGIEWVLRTIDKDVAKALPPGLRNRFTIAIVQNMVSAAHPYAPLVVARLAKATGVIATDPRFFIVPDDPALGKYKDTFANKVVLLERREVARGKVETKNTEELIETLLMKPAASLQQSSYLKARLLDMLIADWDRHYDQWRWMEQDAGKGNYYLALPKDRDQALFRSTGLLVVLVRPFFMKHLVGFTPRTSNLRRLNAKSWNLDRLFLNRLTRSDWEDATRTFLAGLTDEAIAGAVSALPPELRAMDSARFARTLISRRNRMQRDVMRYYQFLSERVSIHGTDEAEHFELRTAGDSLHVAVYANGENSRPFYSRSFHASETGRIRLLGLGGDDRFTIAEELKHRIQIEIDGGTGNNTYAIRNQRRVEHRNSNRDARTYLEELRRSLPIRD